MAKDLDKHTTRVPNITERKPPRAALDWTEANALQIQLSGAWGRIHEATGHETVSDEIISQAAMLGSQGKRLDAQATDFVLGFVDAMQPKDAAEALLLTQMAATHQATMMLARQLNHAENIPQKDCAEKALNKTARTFASQMETLKRYRSKGQQVVRVERVTVNEGGQAIVGAVETGGRK
jgi:hypothetical protein